MKTLTNKENKTPFEWLCDRIETQKQITNYHLGSDVLEFEENFYQNKMVKNIKRKFTLQMKKLQKSGIVSKPFRIYVGSEGLNVYGTKFQTFWTKI